MKKLILNFGHRFSTIALNKMEKIYPDGYVIEDVEVDIELRDSLKDQISSIIDSIQNDIYAQTPIIVLPGLSVASVGLLVELHGRLGHFPNLLEIKRDIETNSYIPVGKDINLNLVRKQARSKRILINEKRGRDLQSI